MDILVPYSRSTGDISSDFICTSAPDEVTSVITKLGGYGGSITTKVS